jgi:hypothetical protein
MPKFATHILDLDTAQNHSGFGTFTPRRWPWLMDSSISERTQPPVIAFEFNAIIRPPAYPCLFQAAHKDMTTFAQVWVHSSNFKGSLTCEKVLTIHRFLGKVFMLLCNAPSSIITFCQKANYRLKEISSQVTTSFESQWVASTVS